MNLEGCGKKRLWYYAVQNLLGDCGENLRPKKRIETEGFRLEAQVVAPRLNFQWPTAYGCAWVCQFILQTGRQVPSTLSTRATLPRAEAPADIAVRSNEISRHVSEAASWHHIPCLNYCNFANRLSLWDVIKLYSFAICLKRLDLSGLHRFILS